MIFQGLSVDRNCLRPETTSLTMLAIKKGLLCNFAKTFNILLDKIARVWNFQLLLNSKSLKLSLHSLLKNMSKTSMGVLKKETIFFKFCLCSKCRYFSITRFDILIFCNILHLEMNFGNLHSKMIVFSFFFFFFDKSLVKINKNKKSKKTKWHI